MREKIKRYRVPAGALRLILTDRLARLRAELRQQKVATGLRQEELEKEALPALRARYEELVAEWKLIPDDIRQRTPQPKLIERGSSSAIIVYRAATPGATVSMLLSWGPRNRDRWFEDTWIKISDVHQFRHTRRGWDPRLEASIRKSQQLLTEYMGNGEVLMSRDELEQEWKLSAETFPWVMW